MVFRGAFARGRFWYESALIDFDCFRNEAEQKGREIVATIPRAQALIDAQDFLAQSATRYTVQFWFGKHFPGRCYLDQDGKEKWATEDGAYLIYSFGPTGAVAVFLQPARSEVMNANEKFVLLHIGRLSWFQLCGRLRRDLKDLVAYNYATTLDGEPTIVERVRVAWIKLVSLIEVRGEQSIPARRVLFGGIGFLARVSVMAMLKPLGALVVIIAIAAYFGFDARPYVMKVFGGPSVP